MRKLSELTFERGAEVTGTLLLCFSEILENPKVDRLIGEIFDFGSFVKEEEIKGEDGKVNKQMTADYAAMIKAFSEGGAKIVSKLIGILLKDYFDVVVEIISVFTEQTTQEVKKNSTLEILKNLKEIFKDKELLELFMSVQSEKVKEKTES